MIPFWIFLVRLCAQPDLEAQANRLRELIRTSPPLPMERTELVARAPRPGWAMDMISSVAVGRQGVTYLLQRGEKADPIVAIDREGRVLRSWGKGLYTIPHSIRVDPAGNIWTTDAASSRVLKFTSEGKELLRIEVGEQPAGHPSPFRGTTDIAFGPDGRLFISDGYGNARILEYSANGRRVRQWGSRGTGPGQFNLPHGISIDERGTVYVADRENGRIQRFDLNGRYLGEWSNLGKTFSLTAAQGALWIGTQLRTQPNDSPGWLMKVDRETGRIIGVVESAGKHSVEITASGELITGTRPDKVLWFRRR